MNGDDTSLDTLARLHNLGVSLQEEQRLRHEERDIARRNHYQWHRSLDHIRERLDAALTAAGALNDDLRSVNKFDSAMVSPRDMLIRTLHVAALLKAIEEQITTEGQRHGGGGDRFCACGRVKPDCDGSRVGCHRKAFEDAGAIVEVTP